MLSETIDQVVVGRVDTPFGPFWAVFTSHGLARLVFPNEPRSLCDEWVARWAPRAVVVREDDRLGALSEQISAYLEGRLRRFSMPLHLKGTPFQVRVWNALINIGYGSVSTYKEVAEAIGVPRATRAVGSAIGANPVPIIVPCHRVIGSDGSLTGFGAGLDMKRRLLELEVARCRR